MMANFLAVLCCFLSVNVVLGQFGLFGSAREDRYGTPLTNIRQRVHLGLNRLLNPFGRRISNPQDDRIQNGRPFPNSVVFPDSQPHFVPPVETAKNFDQNINSDYEIVNSNNWVVFPDDEKADFREDNRFNNEEGVPEDTEATLPPLTPVPTLKPLTPVSTLPPLTPVHTQSSLTPVSTLPPLTPVPTVPSRSNFNFDNDDFPKDRCTTVDNTVGTCLRITECQPLLELVKKIQSGAAPRSVTNVLKRAHCGFDGNVAKVCCPKTTILFTVATPPPTTTTSTTTTTTEAPERRSEDYSDIFPEPPVCGVGNFSGFRVVGGENATLGAFPYMALLGYRRGDATRWRCGGSLVTARHVLTAAHCIYNHENELYVVRLGELDYSTDADGAQPVDVLIKKSIRHENYNPKNYENDVGVLVLDRDVQFNDLIRPICLPMDAELRARSFENYTPIIAGWGNVDYQGPVSPHLQYVQLPVVSTASCAAKFSSHPAQVIDARVLCAGAGGGKDACKGDSGGPLMQPIYNKDTSTTFMYQIGVVSYGKGCAFENFPGVYSRVTHFIPWIQQQIAQNLR